MEYDRFISMVESRTPLRRPEAERVACATLQTLERRLSAGEAEDIATLLPELRPALTRGLVEGGPGAVPIPLEAFIERIARREGVSDEEATAHAAAVFAVLRETVGEEEFVDTLAQLPESYRPLLRQRSP